MLNIVKGSKVRALVSLSPGAGKTEVEAEIVGVGFCEYKVEVNGNLVASRIGAGDIIEVL